jgi:hypothetical protein
MFRISREKRGTITIGSLKMSLVLGGVPGSEGRNWRVRMNETENLEPFLE